MKRRLMLAAMSLILTVTLSVTSMNTVAEASPKMSPTEENLEITINSFLESDGAVAEELTDEMLKTFLETPLDFLRVIDTYPLDKQELLLSRIANVAVGMPDEERLSFEDSGKNLQFTIHAYLPQSRILQMAESVSELP